MSAFSIAAPSIVPLRLPSFRDSRVIDVETKIEITSTNQLPCIEIFYTLDGTKPQPYVLIAQGSKTCKYTHPFSLPGGKITIKAIAIHSRLATLASNIVTKDFFVLDVQKKDKSCTFRDSKVNISEVENNAVVQESYTVEPDKEEIYIVACDEEMPAAEYNDEEMSTLGEFLVEKNENSTASNSEILECHNDKSDFTNEDINVEESEVEKKKLENGDLIFVNTCIQTESYKDVSEMQNIGIQCPSPHSPAELDIPFQYCSTCKKINNLTSRFCDNCGTKLFKICCRCDDQNVISANFCQNCGKTFLQSESSQEEVEVMPLKQMKSIGMLVNPCTTNVTTDVSCLISSHSISTQTHFPYSYKELGINRMTEYSAGQGYWRQQVDYICNYLKIHTNNNLPFQAQIGRHRLHKLLSAEVVANEETLSLHMVFDYMPTRCDVNARHPSKYYGCARSVVPKPHCKVPPSTPQSYRQKWRK